MQQLQCVQKNIAEQNCPSRVDIAIWSLIPVLSEKSISGFEYA